MSNYYEGTECPRHGWSSNNAYKECPHCKKEDIEIADLKAKYQKALSALKYYGSTSLGETGAWGFRKKFCFDLVQTEDLEFLPEPIGEKGHKYVIGGKLARQTLAELGEKEQA